MSEAPPSPAPLAPWRRHLRARVLHAGNRVFCRGYHRLDVSGQNRVPRTGRAILVCNHISGLDPLLIQSAVGPRLVVWMMAKEYHEIRSIAWVFHAVDAIPVARSGRDTAATRAALRALNEDRVLGIFPEGKIETSRALLPFQPGVAQLAIRTGAPVFPAYIEGTNRGMEMIPAFVNANRVRLRFGPPVEFDRTDTDRDRLEAAAEAIRQAVARLRDQDLRQHPRATG